MVRRSSSLSIVLALSACGGTGGGDDGLFAEDGGLTAVSAGESAGGDNGNGEGSTGSADSAASSGAGSDDSADDDGASGTGGIKYDLASDEGGAEVGGRGGCNAVDLLFVIDNSGSMQPYQTALAQTFPLFVDAIFANLPAGTDLHVGITNTSFGSPQAGGVGGSGCDNSEYEAEALASHYPPPSEPNGQNGGQGRLYSWEGKTYFAANTDDDPAPLSDWFTGAASAIGEQGSNWEMVAAGGAFVCHPDNAAANAGFIRDEGAVLVVFILTDEYDNSPEDAAVYHDMIVAAKSGCGGDLCVVPAGLTPPCVPATPGNVLNEFLHSFGKEPVLGDIGDPDNTAHYPDVVGDALAQIIAQTCEDIRPEG